jgi:hypothetical protein
LAGALASALNWFTGKDKSAESGSSSASAGGRVGGSVTLHPSRILVRIYALQQSSIDGVIRAIEEVMREYDLDHVMSDPKDQELIAKLTEEQVTV